MKLLPFKHIREYTVFFIFRGVLFPLLFFMPVFLEGKGITGWQVGLLYGGNICYGGSFVAPIRYS